MELCLVSGARPNFMKIAPLIWQLNRKSDIFTWKLVHTGQHYDQEMFDFFFHDLDLPQPNINFGIRSSTTSRQIAEIMIHFDNLLQDYRPDIVVVVGDVNSTISATVVSSHHQIPVAHIESGLRSFDRSMPEEINRIVTDRLSTYLFTTCLDAYDNLISEGISSEYVHSVGNIMIDSLVHLREPAQRSNIRKKLDLEKRPYCLVTIHRPGNVDNQQNLIKVTSILLEIAKRIKVVIPVHPRTKKQLRLFNLENSLANHANIIMLPPLGYIDFLHLEMNSSVVVTDSGGIQEETTFFNVPCLTMRPNTERPVTINMGTNALVSLDIKAIKIAIDKILDGRWKEGVIPELWDGNTAERILGLLESQKY